MSGHTHADNAAWLIPPQALREWLELARKLDEAGIVPCRTSDAEAWWPSRTEVDELPARMAVDACSTCGARDACLAYAPKGASSGRTTRLTW